MIKRLFSRNPQKFSSRRFNKVIKNAIKFLERSPLHSLNFQKFSGSGVYALYYLGNFYSELVEEPSQICINPIYIGKAVPTGWRTARVKHDNESTNLYKRLREHITNIDYVNNLNLEDFSCRYVTVDPDLIAPLEAEMIRRYQPLWNSVIDGFGNHNVGKTRFDQAKSEWDILHPGRPWVENMRGKSPTFEQVVEKIQTTLRK